MVAHLHKGFLSSREHYNQAAEYWRTLCEDVLRRTRRVEEWKPWLAAHLDPSAIVVEEGPIYSLHSERQNKGLTIEQYLPKGVDVEISAMTDEFGEGVLKVPTDYLRISCALSEESSAIARQLIEGWVNDEARRSEFEEIIDRLIPVR